LLCLGGTGLTAKDKLFIGWFGPRGLASIVFAVMAVDAEVPGTETIGLVVSVTILLSVIAHGLSAKPFSRMLGGGCPESSRRGS